MAQAGKYNRQFTHLKRSISKDTTNGQDEETFTSNGTLWGSCKELGAYKQLAYGMQNSQADMEIRLRQWPNVDAKDRLRDLRFNQLLIIDGITHEFEKNELVIYCHKLTEVV